MPRTNLPRQRLPRLPEHYLARHLVALCPKEINQTLLADCQLVRKLEIPVMRSMNIAGQLSVDQDSFFKAVKKIAAGTRNVAISTAENTELNVEAERQPNGAFKLVTGSIALTDLEADLLSAKKQRRLECLQRICRRNLLGSQSTAAWHQVLTQRPLVLDEFVRLSREAVATPEHFPERLCTPGSVSVDQLVPEDFSYFETLVPRPAPDEPFAEYLNGRLALERAYMLETTSTLAHSRIAVTALNQTLIPFDLYDDVEPEILMSLSQRQDPFSLLFVFEVTTRQFKCRPEFVEIGRFVLEKLLAEEGGAAERSELLAAGAAVAYAGLHNHISARSAPTYWRRLAAFAHAGVITNTLFNSVDAKEFREWAFAHFSSFFHWGNLSERRNAPRWRSSWVHPQALHAEFVGRSLGALNLIPKGEQPSPWAELLEKSVQALAKQKAHSQMFFAGPMDDFQAQGTPLDLSAFEHTLAALASGISLVDVPGLAPLIFLAGMTEEHLQQFEAGLAGTPIPADAEAGRFMNLLDLAAYASAVHRSPTLAAVVAEKALIFFSERQQNITNIGSILVGAANALEQKQANYSWLGTYFLRLSRICNRRKDADKLIRIIDEIYRRDAEYRPYLSRAYATSQILRNAPGPSHAGMIGRQMQNGVCAPRHSQHDDGDAGAT